MQARKILDRLEQVKGIGGNRWKACCPAHTDTNPSLAISETDDGTVLIKCWAGCSPLDIITAVGLEWSDLFPPDSVVPERKLPKPKTEMDRLIIQTLGHMADADTDQLVLDIARLMRRQGVQLSPDDIKREEQAFLRSRGRAS